MITFTVPDSENSVNNLEDFSAAILPFSEMYAVPEDKPDAVALPMEEAMSAANLLDWVRPFDAAISAVVTVALPPAFSDSVISRPVR